MLALSLSLFPLSVDGDWNGHECPLKAGSAKAGRMSPVLTGFASKNGLLQLQKFSRILAQNYRSESSQSSISWFMGNE
jgi:hypothetical protein